MRRTFSVSSEVVSQEVSGETVLLDLKSEHYFGLDEVGTRIWQLLREHADLQTIFDILLAEYDVAPEQLSSDIDTLITQLKDAGLIEAGDSEKDATA